MDWQSLPPSPPENIDDRRNDPVPWWAHLGLDQSPGDLFGGMVDSLRNPLTAPTPGPRGSSPEGWRQRVTPAMNPGPLELSLGINQINPRDAELNQRLAQLLMASPVPNRLSELSNIMPPAPPSLANLPALVEALRGHR